MASATQAGDALHSTSEGKESTAPKTLWASVRAGLGALLGLLPHVMHHIGLIAGAALLTGVGGSAALYAVGLVFSIPLLRRLKNRYRTWAAPAIGVAVFTALFALSALVIGPALTGAAPASPKPAGAPSVEDVHAAHHP